MVAARAGAACAPMASRRACISAMREGSVAVSASARRRVRSASAASTTSIAVSSPPGASCATVASLAPGRRLIEPASAPMSPWIAFSRVDLPVPLRPISPTRLPAGT
jgi:hypothetical protein